MIPIGSRTAMLVEGIALEVALPAMARYPWIDRGAYAIGALDPAIAQPLARFIPADDPRRTIVSAHAIALAAGDYILAHHDPLPPLPAPDELYLELVLDLSPRAVPNAELYYRRRGAVFFAVPAAPGTLAVVERGPTITANHAYVSKRDASATIVRLIARARATST